MSVLPEWLWVIAGLFAFWFSVVDLVVRVL